MAMTKKHKASQDPSFPLFAAILQDRRVLLYVCHVSVISRGDVGSVSNTHYRTSER
jgi:hypothetical protein